MTNDKNKPNAKKTILQPRDIEILTFVANHRIATFSTIFKTFYAGMKIDAAKSTLRRLLGSEGGQRFLRPQKIDAKRVGYVLTRRGCRTLNISTKISCTVGRITTIKQIALGEYLREPKRSLLRGNDLRELLKTPIGRLPLQHFVTEESENCIRLKIVFIHYGGAPTGTARRIAQKLAHIASQGWINIPIRDRILDVVVLTGISPTTETLHQEVTNAVDLALLIDIRKLIGNEQPSSVIGVSVVFVPTIETLILSRDHGKAGRNPRE